MARTATRIPHTEEWHRLIDRAEEYEDRARTAMAVGDGARASELTVEAQRARAYAAKAEGK